MDIDRRESLGEAAATNENIVLQTIIETAVITTATIPTIGVVIVIVQ